MPSIHFLGPQVARIALYKSLVAKAAYRLDASGPSRRFTSFGKTFAIVGSREPFISDEDFDLICYDYLESIEIATENSWLSKALIITCEIALKLR